jgi:RNA polymerase sigma factor (sigma-70 family)
MATAAENAALGALALRVQAKDRHAAGRLVTQLEGLVRSRASWFGRSVLHDEATIEDLRQEARMGVLRAAESWSPTGGATFMSYATMWADHRLGAYVRDRLPIVRIPDSDENAKRLRWKPARSLDVPTHDDGEATAGDLIPDDGPGADRLLAANDDAREAVEVVARALNRLPAKGRELLLRRHLSDAPETLDEIGASWGRSKQRVQQVEADALAKLVRVLGGDREGAAKRLRALVLASRFAA